MWAKVYHTQKTEKMLAWVPAFKNILGTFQVQLLSAIKLCFRDCFAFARFHLHLLFWLRNQSQFGMGQIRGVHCLPRCGGLDLGMLFYTQGSPITLSFVAFILMA